MRFRLRKYVNIQRKIFTTLLELDYQSEVRFCCFGFPACPVCYLPVEEAIEHMPRFPSPSPVLKNLTYVHGETLSREGEFGGSDFGGYPTLRQRNDSYDIRESMNVHCG